MQRGAWTWRDPGNLAPGRSFSTDKRAALCFPAQAGQAPAMGRRVRGASQHWGNVGCAMLPALTGPKVGSKKGTPLTDHRRPKRGFTLKTALCSNPAGFFLTLRNTQTLI